jgi:hypothetical protein
MEEYDRATKEYFIDLIKSIWRNKLFLGHQLFSDTFDITYDFVDENMKNFKFGFYIMCNNKIIVGYEEYHIYNKLFIAKTTFSHNYKIIFNKSHYCNDIIMFIHKDVKCTFGELTKIKIIGKKVLNEFDRISLIFK